MKKICMILALFLIVACVVAMLGVSKHAADTPEKMILCEILPQYEWQAYAYDSRKLSKEPNDGRNYYIAVFYTDVGKFEFLCVINGDDVDEELVYGKEVKEEAECD